MVMIYLTSLISSNYNKFSTFYSKHCLKIYLIILFPKYVRIKEKDGRIFENNIGKYILFFLLLMSP